MDVLGLAVNQTPHELLATQHAFLAIGTGPVEIDRFCGQITFCILRPPAGRLFATSFPPLLLLVPRNAEIARLFRRLGLLGLSLVHEQLLQLLDLFFKFLDPRSLLFNPLIALAKLLFLNRFTNGA